MSVGWFGRSSCRIDANELKPGNRYRRRLSSGGLAATATVLALRSDLAGIPHVHFSVTIDGSATCLSEGETRVLALASFLDAYRERLAQDAPAASGGLAGATLVRLSARPLKVDISHNSNSLIDNIGPTG
jgi:hypothetical protein